MAVSLFLSLLSLQKTLIFGKNQIYFFPFWYCLSWHVVLKFHLLYVAFSFFFRLVAVEDTDCLTKTKKNIPRTMMYNFKHFRVKMWFCSKLHFLHPLHSALFSAVAPACHCLDGAACHTDVWMRTCEQYSQRECPQCLSLWPEFCDDRQFYKQLGINQSPLEICHLPLLH